MSGCYHNCTILTSEATSRLREPRSHPVLASLDVGCSKAYQVVDAHTSHRLRQWLCRKHRVNGKGIIRYPDQYLYETLRLVRLPGLTRNLPWAKA